MSVKRYDDLRAALQALPRFKQVRVGQWKACCPAHDDRNPSLSITEAADGKLLLTCHAGCASEAIVEALGFTMADLFPPSAPSHRDSAHKSGQRKPPVVTRYRAITAEGEIVGVHGRRDYLYADGTPYKDKDLWWEAHHGHSPQEMPLYNLPVLLEATPGTRVIVTEGEKAASALVKAGALAVGTMTGASSIPCDQSLRPLLDRQVILWPDNDDPGHQHMSKIADRLIALGMPPNALFWVNWTVAPAKGDAADYLARGGTVDGIWGLLEEDENAPSKSEPPAVFPLAALPKVIRNLVTEGAQAIGCPQDFLALPALTAAGAAIGTSTGLEIKPGWIELPLLETAIVAEPGSAKSPAAELANRPIIAHQRELDRRFQAAMRDYLAAKDDETIARAEKPPEPKYQQVWTNDATLEALGDALEANPRGLLFMRDELAGWARAMNQYKGGKGADRQAWLSLWSCQSIMINRRGRKVPQHVFRPFVAVSGTIQPDILGELSDERGREDGFIHRILFAYPARIGRRWTEDTVSWQTEDAYRDLFVKLWALEHDSQTDVQGNVIDSVHTNPHVLRFTSAGKRAWVEWITDHYAEMDAPGFPVNLRGPWSKMEGYAARFALIVHVCRRECGETASHDVDQVSMLAAAALVDYFKSHVRAIYRELRASPEDKQVVDALVWIGRQPERMTTARQLLTAGIGGVSNAEEAKKLLEQLKERGYGTIEERPSKHGKPSFKFTLHAPASSINAPAQKGRAA